MSFAARHGLTPRRIGGSAAAVHARPLEAEPLIEVVDVDGPAVVLGSAQRDVVIDAAALSAAGAPEVTRRRGGGGAVWVAPAAGWWFDVTVPRDDPRWSDDVGAAFLWLGDALADWLAELPLPAPVRFEVHRGSMVSSAWSSSVCFAGVGPGEVLVEGRKLVGVSQRRTRDAARFMCWMPSVWSPDPLAGLVLDGVAAEDLAAVRRELQTVGIGWFDLHGTPPEWSPGADDDPVVRALLG